MTDKQEVYVFFSYNRVLHRSTFVGNAIAKFDHYPSLKQLERYPLLDGNVIVTNIVYLTLEQYNGLIKT